MRTSILACALALALVVACAVFDWRSRRVPNALTLPAIVVGLSLHGLFGGASGILFSLKGLALGAGLFLIPYCLGGMGAGDVKLMGALGAWLGSSLTLTVFLVSTSLAVLATAMILLVGMLSRGYGSVHRRYVATGSTSRPNKRKRESREQRQLQRQKRRLMPYAVPVALSTWLVLAIAWKASNLPW